MPYGRPTLATAGIFAMFFSSYKADLLLLAIALERRLFS